MRMRYVRLVISLFAGCLLVAPAMVFAVASTCADGGILCNAACHTSTACGAGAGVSYSGMCIGGSNQQSTTCQLTRCSSLTPTCAGGPFSGKIGCSTDTQCGSGFICVSSSGSSGCGTAYSQCMTACSDSTTTTTTTTTTT